MLANAKNLINRIRTHAPELLIGLGVCFLLLNGVHSIVRDRALRLHEGVVAKHYEDVPEFRERAPRPNHIYIEWFVDVGIHPADLVNRVWTISPDRGSYLTQSARPGEQGNIIIYGHNTREILGNIRALKGGEIITITTEDGAGHLYQVTELHEVDPSQTDLLQPTDTEVLTIYTCSGLLDSQRFVVRAVPITE